MEAVDAAWQLRGVLEPLLAVWHRNRYFTKSGAVDSGAGEPLEHEGIKVESAGAF